MLIAIGNHPDLGVDVELSTGTRNFANAIESSLSESGLEHLRAIGRLPREGVLLRYWSHKEALPEIVRYLSCSFPLSDVRVNLIDEVGSIMRACTGQLEITLHGREIDCRADHVASLAADPAAPITQFQV